ncbi:MAG: hypothetical protein RIC55_27450 [Pirellulaceae bacterium]
MDENLLSEDRRHLHSLRRKLQVVKDRVVGVARRRHTGFFLGGRGGIGKSFTVAQELERLGEPYKLWNSTMTARCLFDSFASYPDAVHVLEDVETLTKDRRAIGVLRSALWGTRRGRDGRMERVITWNARGAKDDAVFTGGVIMTSNRRLADLPELDALKTRISWMNLDVSDPETAALMRSIAAGGWPKDQPLLDPEQCEEVVDFIVIDAALTNRRLDVRLLINSFEDRLQYEDFETGCSWQDLVATRIRERPVVADEIERNGVRAQKRAAQLEIARQVTGLPAEERLRVWQQKTGGASRATLYRRLAELAAMDACEFEN